MLYTIYTQILSAEGLSAVTDEQLVVVASYGGPGTLGGRREEVMLRKREEGGRGWSSPFGKI